LELRIHIHPIAMDDDNEMDSSRARRLMNAWSSLSIIILRGR
jgi:hypothetical protein